MATDFTKPGRPLNFTSLDRDATDGAPVAAFPVSGPRVKAYFAQGIEMHDMAGALKDCRRYLTQFGCVDPEQLKQQIDDALAMYELREAQANSELAEKSA